MRTCSVGNKAVEDTACSSCSFVELCLRVSLLANKDTYQKFNRPVTCSGMAFVMSNNKHLNLDQLVIAVILSSSKTKQDIDQLIKEVREICLRGMVDDLRV
ncbi:hypothetical protein E2C01_013450 [Portunus trituberculatus]|uniref:Uncharacterized protein n=1 Tax=Portunus trituberculatus TaxID=210409 RepID=A0A5B7DH32_PORTR|nr:hypothetical protein [Portunus trituberculatus]